MTSPEIVPLGEHALIVRLSGSLDAEINKQACAIADAIEGARIGGVIDVVPANSSVGIYLDERAPAQAVKIVIAEILRRTRPVAAIPGQLHEIPVAYNGPDLDTVAAQTGLSASSVIEIHASREYQVFAVGFAPGFGYLGELDQRISVPRRAEPRTKVAAGSVAIANRQTAIYPMDTPGGWNIIGATPTRIFDIERDPACLFRVGDRVRFVPS